MDIDEAMEQLRQWCDASAGSPVELAKNRLLVFQSKHLHPESSVQAIEQTLGCSLPHGYRRFMEIIGESTLFVKARDAGDRISHSGGIQFFSPEEVIQTASRIWDEETKPGTDRFCFVGQHMSMGDYLGFTLNRPAPANFDVYCHEYPPQDYVGVSDQLRSWRSFDSWLIRAVESKGEDTL